MKYSVHYSARFKKSLKRAKQLPAFNSEKLKDTITVLAQGGILSSELKDHKLTGNMKKFRECHLAPDILLVYEIDDGILTLTLVNICNQSQLFK